jgi:hypothetical protein
MAKQTEKLSQETLDKIVKSQEEANQIIFELGQLSLRIREFTVEIKNMEDLKKAKEDKFDNLSLQLENTISDLQRKYPNGEINLEDGIVTFETSE